MRPLGVKLIRDLWGMKGQAIAIGVVIAIGVAMQVMMTGLFLSLSQTRDAYYERYRFAHVFAPAARAPERLADRLALIDGVALVETRIAGTARIDLAGRDLPVAAKALSLPADGSPAINDILLTAGRALDPARPDEIILLNSFAAAQNLTVGDSIDVTMNGARHSLDIVGLGQSPEFIYSAAPGEMIPDDARYAVIWMNRSALAAAYDLDGAFNEALFTLSRDARPEAVLDAIDLILAPYGAPGAYARSDHMSDRFISEEIRGLSVSSTSVPPVFIGVAAFLLYIVISRLVQSEREEIGLMKAFGYRNREIGLHYMELVLTIALGGALLGCILGIFAGRALVPVYTTYYKFPFLLFRLEPASFLTGVATSVGVASLGGLIVLRRIVALAPAEAMRPPAPPDYRRAGRIGAGLAQWLDQPSRMVLRRITRQPWRMGATVVGIAAGMGLSLGMLTIYEGFDAALTRSFNDIDRSEATVSFAIPAGPDALLELGRLDGVTKVEPVRQVGVVFVNGLLTDQGAITGLANGGTLFRALDADNTPVPLPARGIVLSTALAAKLGVTQGDTLTLDVREGAQPRLTVPVAGVADIPMGTPAYMEIGALNTLMGEWSRASGAYLSIDADHTAAVQRALRDMPMVAGVSLKAEAETAFKQIMDQGAGSMRYVMGFMAFIITFGIVYNAARVAQAERARDMASLRVMGFRTGETAFVLLGELAVVVLAALPLGILFGRGLSQMIAAGFSTDIYSIPVVHAPRAKGIAMGVVVAAAVASGWLVKRDLDRADMISALKTRE